MGLELQTIDESGNVPVSVIKDSSSARTIFVSLLQDDMPNNQMRAQIEGMLDGNSPFDDQQLIDMGQAGRTNCNWGTARARVNQAKQPHYDLLTSVSNYVTVKTEYGGARLANTYSRIISEEMSRTLDEWDEFLEQMEIHQQELVVHGIGPCFWRDEKDWRFKALLRRNMLVPSNAKSSRNNQTLVYIRDSMEAHELYAYVKDPDVAAATGWDTHWAKEAIRQSAVTEEDRTRDWEWWQAQFKDNNYFISYAKTRQIHIIHALAKEFDGKVSHYIFTRQPIGGPDSKDDFIYRKVGRFGQMNEVIWMCFDGVGNGDFKSVRGLGNEVFHFGEAANRLNNATIDGAIRSTCTMWQAETGADAQRFNMIEIGPDRLLPTGFKDVSLSNLGNNIKQAMEVASYFQMMESSNTGGYRASMDSKDGNPITATEAQMQAGEKASMTSSKTEHYLRAADRLYSETGRRMCNPDLIENVDPGANEALAFQKRCRDRGVPMEALKQIRSVKATRGIGNGSSSGRIMAMQQLAPIVYARSPEVSQKNFTNDLIGAMAGTQYAVEAYGIPTGKPEPGMDERWATMENNDFLTGGHVQFLMDDDHLTHATYHINFMAGLMQDVQSGAIDPIKASMALDDAGPHTIQHLQVMASDPTRKAALASLKDQFQQIITQANEVRQAAKQMEKKQAEQAQSQSGHADNLRELLNFNYKDAPEEIKMEIEQMYGFRRNGGASPVAENLRLKDEQLNLKTQKQQVDTVKTQQSMVLEDAKTADQIANSHVDRKVKQQPKPKVNGTKKK